MDFLLSFSIVLPQCELLEAPVQRGSPGEGNHCNPENAIASLGPDLH